MKLIDAERFLKETPIVNGNYDRKNANPHFIAGVRSVAEMLHNLPPAYYDIDVLRTQAINEYVQVLKGMLNIEHVLITTKYIHLRYNGIIYIVKEVGGCTPKEIGNIIRDLILSGECDYPTTKKQAYVRGKKNG